MPGLTSRICGICPVSHLLASAKAGDAIMAVRIPPAADKLRRLMNLDWTFLPLVAVAVALGAMALTLAFGLAGTLAALRQRPLALLRNE